MKNSLAKSLITKVVVGLLVAAVLGGCGTLTQESAMEWMQRQPQTI